MAPARLHLYLGFISQQLPHFLLLLLASSNHIILCAPQQQSHHGRHHGNAGSPDYNMGDNSMTINMDMLYTGHGDSAGRNPDLLGSSNVLVGRNSEAKSYNMDIDDYVVRSGDLVKHSENNRGVDSDVRGESSEHVESLVGNDGDMPKSRHDIDMGEALYVSPGEGQTRGESRGIVHSDTKGRVEGMDVGDLVGGLSVGSGDADPIRDIHIREHVIKDHSYSHHGSGAGDPSIVGRGEPMDMGRRDPPIDYGSRHSIDLDHIGRGVDPLDFAHESRMSEEGSGHGFQDDPLIIETKKGKVRGITLTAATGKLVDAWLGIPYAQKPIGKIQSITFIGISMTKQEISRKSIIQLHLLNKY